MLRPVLLLLALLLPAQAFALSSDWVAEDVASARLVSDSDTVGTGAQIGLGLEVRLANGWHSYWRSPGAAGVPPQLEWVHSASEDDNVKSVTLLYPAPRRYTAYGLETVGYRDHVLFPIDVVLAKAGMPLNAELSLDLLVCSSICVPKHFDLKLALPAGASKPSAEAPLLRAARDQLPTDPDNAGLLLRGVKNDGQNLTFTIASREALVQPDVFVENAKSIGFGAPKIQVDPHGHSADLTVAVVDTLPAETALAGMPLTLTFINGNDAVEIKAIAPKAVLAPPPPAPQHSRPPPHTAAAHRAANRRPDRARENHDQSPAAQSAASSHDPASPAATASPARRCAVPAPRQY